MLAKKAGGKRMADQEHLDRLKEGIDAWNSWRQVTPDIHPDLREANLSYTALNGINLTGADLTGAAFVEADLTGATLVGANLSKANLSKADLTRANLSGASLTSATIVDTDLTEAILTDCSIFGISAWNVQLEGATQLNLLITPEGEPAITIDNLKIAQFIYLLLNNAEIRDAIDTLTTKSVLILARFTAKRKPV